MILLKIKKINGLTTEGGDILKGTVKWFNAMKGFGFITPEEGGKDVFVHQSALDPETVLAEGDEVEFEIGDSPKGPQAKNVKKL
ncbi:MAG: cold-shock protein [Candidatus Aenigmarchaeota archaeon CG_4_10_14_0_8_um_filter_37_24]|nr:cold shock domain-containing protein [Candidatus Aenigmarchaeota archaeon]OIN86957.1 MAG: cold-shock protein [Candidatus Aenigmarchaeota archaeon CG1_02_38_14]PIV69329.1 MAG: cold-shock protein [Candidatus Aenigmarchaeota archaeon CG01_land_8_20_14_3_00_37_9]PIW41267.1 MAG: cold-shock protein [Candidatus Aenigmarchaeota archaeon CG15_BIG_FIL_POST_REV_8_21_14_020_37_27]PIX50879.1 MAG: cold-shock protein [Candidatus Aenigmarchaeota archaeon CG_4_8_14_3_um_filter_37_24]PIY36013.1 MAG: cold-sho